MTKQTEAMKLALEGAANYIDALGGDSRKYRQALAEQPAQQLPFGVGGGLVAIKTLLSRDPCAHATIAIQMIDAILAEHPTQQQEPVAWVLEWTFNGEERGRRLYDDETHCVFDAENDGGVCRPLVYGDTSPPAQRKPLTDEEIWDEVKAADLDWQTGWSLDEDASNRYITFARAIEAAIWEKLK